MGTANVGVPASGGRDRAEEQRAALDAIANAGHLNDLRTLVAGRHANEHALRGELTEQDQECAD